MKRKYDNLNKGYFSIRTELAVLVDPTTNKQVLVLNSEYMDMLVQGFSPYTYDAKASVALWKHSFTSQKAVKRYIMKRGIISFQPEVEVVVRCKYKSSTIGMIVPVVTNKPPKNDRKVSQIKDVPFDPKIEALKDFYVCMEERSLGLYTILCTNGKVILNIAFNNEGEWDIYFDKVEDFACVWAMYSYENEDEIEDINTAILDCIRIAPDFDPDNK